MLNLSNQTTLVISYTDFLARSNIAKTYESFYLKWLRFYLDFCQKYSYKSEDALSLPKFIEKLKTKNQSDAKCRQAEHAVSLYYNLINGQTANPEKFEHNVKIIGPHSGPVSDGGQKDRTVSHGWDRAFRSKQPLGAKIRPVFITFKTSSTTMIYTHAIKKEVKELKSPLDFLP
jgi:hypothetical protein